MIQLSYAPYTLLFHEPFGTAHGLREGTDAVFVRLEREGVLAYGEATLPPYVNENAASVIDGLRGVGLRNALRDGEHAVQRFLDRPESLRQPALRTALHTAFKGLIKSHIDNRGSSEIPSPVRARSMITIGHGPLATYGARLRKQPSGFEILKVKLGTPDDIAILGQVMALDDRPLLLDVNQGWTTVAEAMRVLRTIDTGRVIGVEQPFAKDRVDLHKALLEHVGPMLVIADESVQELDDLDRAAGGFNAVNLKLMKCGGVDRASAMAERARSLGMRVMLGSMSESTLGCATMLQLAPIADLLDLDGPWLIKNDPFKGMVIVDGHMAAGSVELRAGFPLDWRPIGA